MTIIILLCVPVYVTEILNYNLISPSCCYIILFVESKRCNVRYINRLLRFNT